jgi:quercetin dioxygenase-like cupin family protein
LVPVGLEPTTVMHAEAENGDSREHASARPVTITRPVSCEELDHVPGKSITTAIVEFPPNAYTPRHRHPGSVTVFVLKGRIRSQLGGGPWTNSASEIVLSNRSAQFTFLRKMQASPKPPNSSPCLSQITIVAQWLFTLTSERAG